MKGVVSGAVGWLAGSLWGKKNGEQDEDEKQRTQQTDARMVESEHVNANDETINYDDILDEDEDAYDDLREDEHKYGSSSAAHGASQLAGLTPSTSRSPRTENILRSPQPIFDASASPLSMGSHMPAFSPVPASSGGASRAPFTPASASGMQKLRSIPSQPSPLHFPPHASPSPTISRNPTLTSSTIASMSPDELLRHAWSLFRSQSLEECSSLLARLPPPAFDSLLLNLARRIADSRRVASRLQQEADMTGDGENELLTGELRHKAMSYETLLLFVRHPLLRTATGSLDTLWSHLTHSTQHALLQYGEFIEVCLSLKQLLNAQPVTFRSVDESGAEVDAQPDPHDLALLQARREVMLECMQYMVKVMRKEEGAERMLKEGLSFQEIVFSETSKMPQLFTAMHQVMFHQADSADATQAKASYLSLMRLTAGTSIVQCVLNAATSFRSHSNHAAWFSELKLPSANEIPSVSWMLAPQSRTFINRLLERLTEQVTALGPGGRLTDLPASAPFNASAAQSHLFDAAFRIARIYLTQYTDFLTLVTSMRQAQSGSQSLSSAVNEFESTIEAEFGRDRAHALNLLIPTSRTMQQHNHARTTVFPLPSGEQHPGVESPSFPPLPALYELAAEFQDLDSLVTLCLSEPVELTSNKRMIYFIVQFGHPFLKQLTHTLLEGKQYEILLGLPALAAAEIPSYAHEAATRGSQLLLRDADDQPLPIGSDGFAPDGFPVVSSWLAGLLKSLPKLSWLHDLQMGQYETAAHRLRTEAHGEKESLVHQKHLLSLSKLSLLAGVDESVSGADAVHVGSDTSIPSSMGEDGALNAREVQSLDDGLGVLLAQEFVEELKASQQGSQEQEKRPVMTPHQLIEELVEAGLDEKLVPSIRLHAFCLAFDVMEKSLLPKPRTTPFDRFSNMNQETMLKLWKALVQADQHRWPSLAAAKKSDPSDEWQNGLRETQLFNLWTEMMKPERRCYDHEEVYVQSFLHFLSHPSYLPHSLQPNDVRSVLESTYKLAKQ